MQIRKTEISDQTNESIAEVEATLAQEEVNLHCTSSAALRNCTMAT